MEIDIEHVKRIIFGKAFVIVIDGIIREGNNY